MKLDVLVNEEPVDALSIICHKDSSYQRGKTLVTKMRSLIPRQMFDVAIQAAIGSRIIARESVKAMRKNVIAKCLRRRHQPKAEAPRKTEGRQEADEAGRQRRHSAGSLPRGAQSRRVRAALVAARCGSRSARVRAWPGVLSKRRHQEKDLIVDPFGILHRGADLRAKQRAIAPS